ncbi:hypothetical protein [Krasilnikovia sp. M28-CT-15]|uniref:hypothetical protein n=1 Tax=Krasilnikovia sp. M28-CT-15 TaxID=3373540 RepID=UPI003876040C
MLAFEDAVGLKVRALHDRAAHRDFIDVQAAHSRISWHDLETLGAHHAAGFSIEELADRLGAVGDLDDGTFHSYGLTASDVDRLRRWAVDWESDIRGRLAAGETGPAGPPDDEWSRYLDPD